MKRYRNSKLLTGLIVMMLFMAWTAISGFAIEHSDTNNAVSNTYTLLNVEKTDFPNGVYDDTCSFFGSEKIQRKDVRNIIVSSSMEKPENVSEEWDVTEAGDRSVLAWAVLDKSDDLYDVAIVSDAAITCNDNSTSLFRKCTNLESIVFEELFYTGYADSLAHMFCDCTHLKQVDLSGIQTGNGLSDLSGMFENCTNMETLDFSVLNTRYVTKMTELFANCLSLDNLYVDEENFESAQLTGGMYDGTKWEGTSPLIEESDGQVWTTCILKTDYSFNNKKLRACLINTYDDKLRGLVNGKYNRFGTWLDDNVHVYYVIMDLDGDAIPELITYHQFAPGWSTDQYTIYSFNVNTCKVNQLPGGIILEEATSLYVDLGSHTVGYYSEDGFHTLLIDTENNAVQELETEPASEENLNEYETIDFTLAVPKLVYWEYMCLNNDDEESEVEIKASKTERGGYNYLVIYVDSHSIFRRELNGNASDIGATWFGIQFYDEEETTEDDTDTDVETENILEKIKNGNEAQVFISDDIDEVDDEHSMDLYGNDVFLYLRIGDNGEDYCGIFRYDKEENGLNEIFTVADMIQSSQLTGNNSYFSVDFNFNGWDGIIHFEIHADTLGLGPDLVFSTDYRIAKTISASDKSYQFKQVTYSSDLEGLWNPNGYVTAAEEFSVYKEVGSRDELYTTAEGDHLKVLSVWLSDGILWVQIENEEGQRGWIPAGDTPLFAELGDSSRFPEYADAYAGSDEEERASLVDRIANIFSLKDSPYFDLTMPSDSTLYELGEDCFHEGDFVDAEVYYGLVNENSEHYEDAVKERTLIESVLYPEKEEDADEIRSSGSYSYRILGDGTAEITDYRGSDVYVTIPKQIDGWKVTSIAGYAFQGCTDMINVEIPEGMGKIALFAFDGCSALENVSIPASVTDIEGNPFTGCTSLTQINISEDNTTFMIINGVLFDTDGERIIAYPAGLSENSYEIPYGIGKIADRAFDSCSSLSEIVIPETVTYFGNRAFNNCVLLDNVVIPAQVTEMGLNPFTMCYGLTDLSVSEESTAFSADDHILVDLQNKKLVSYFAGLGDTEYEVSDNNIEIIGASAFRYNNYLTHVIVSDSVKTIEQFAFSDIYTLQNIELPEKMDAIEWNAFAHCQALEKIRIPEGIKVIDENTFYDCTSLHEVIIPEGVTQIGVDTFSYCSSLSEITLPDSLKSIGNLAFFGCTFTEIVIPENVDEMGERNPFSNCADLNDIQVSEGNPNYEAVDGVLFDKRTEELVAYPGALREEEYEVPEGTEKIGSQAFDYCNYLYKVTLPDSVVSVGEWAFCNCSNLDYINLPDQITYIADTAFQDVNYRFHADVNLGSYAEIYCRRNSIWLW